MLLLNFHLHFLVNFMKPLILGTAGHIDHGKTSLIQALSGKDCDSHPEEKKRGITINLGFSYLKYPNMNIGIIDMPGHKDFVNTMINGAGSIDMALLVIAADSGIMPQTIEHINIIKALRIKHIMVAINKADLVDEEWLTLIKEEVKEWFQQLYPNPKSIDYEIEACSVFQPESIVRLKNSIEQMGQRVQPKPLGKIFRMYIDRWFTVNGLGSVVTGSVLSGTVGLNQDLYLLPNNEKCKVKNIEHHSEKVQEVSAGDRAAFNLGGINKPVWKKGMLLSDEMLESTQRIDAVVQMFDKVPQLGLWSKIMFYSGTYESAARMHLMNKDQIKAGEEAIVQIHLEKPALLINKDRFIIRNSSSDASIGGGWVLDAQALHHRKRRPDLIRNLEHLLAQMRSQASLGALLEMKLSESIIPLSLKELSQQLNEEEEKLLVQLKENDRIGSFQYNKEWYLFDNEKARDLKLEIKSKIETYHQAYFLFDTGVTSQWLSSKLFPKQKGKWLSAYVDLLCQSLQEFGILENRQMTWALKEHQVVITAKQQEAMDFIEQKIRSFGLQKPVFKELVADSKQRSISAEQLKLFLNYLIDKKRLYKYQDDYIHIDNIEQVKQVILPVLETRPEGINLSEFRQLTQCAKKAIPLFVGVLESQQWVKTRAEGTHTIMFL